VALAFLVALKKLLEDFGSSPLQRRRRIAVAALATNLLKFAPDPAWTDRSWTARLPFPAGGAASTEEDEGLAARRVGRRQ